ncbi:protein FAR1-RELATED SEQUENCE 5-like [Cornus florida]|uniref:protein FAR1-RELATED SEQUENCE 5-like n=1 Tax=Cornus florida TaxID=4283 RepID=UPI00289E0944|nr:protein FAR1-RELATED SEQUENCE 5-like [Cornus florida]
MKFETEEEAYDFYNSYASQVSFSVRKEYFNKSKKTAKLSSRLLTCCKEGFRGDDIRDRISPRNSYELMGRQTGGKESVGYMKLDLLNHIRTRRQTELEYGEAAWLMNYFETQSCEDPSFFYAFQLDSDQMITNIFWAD